jgi:surfactin synthase thioesterase subunit
VRLPVTLLFDHPTPAALAARLNAELFPDGEASFASHPTALPAIGLGGPAGQRKQQDPFVSKFLADPSIDLNWEVLDIAARLRRTREEASGAKTIDRNITTLSQGGIAPALLCIPSIALPTGPLQFARFATALRGVHDVRVLHSPGFGENELLPATIDVLLDHHVTEIETCTNGDPFVLVAFSSGGWIAHELVSQLERRGTFPSALVLLDCYSIDAINAHAIAAFRRVFAQIYPNLSREDDEFTAMAWYLRLFRDWVPAKIETKTLLVRASAPPTNLVSGDDDGRQSTLDWRSHWPQPHSLVEAPGDHFTLLTEHAETTAHLVQEWLDTTLM